MSPWTVAESTGPAGAFHARDLAAGGGRQVWVHHVERPALVLGSTQGRDLVDEAGAAALGLEVTTRRSGGGVVLVEPDGCVWVDVVIPPEDPLWDRDVARAAHWVGRAWATTLRSLEVPDVAVHTGPMVTTPWSRLVCFAGMGPGEVTVGGRKAVGVSQRRTRHGARFQTAVLLRWEPPTLLAGLRLEPGERAAAAADLAGRAVGVPVGAEALVSGLLTALPG